MILLYRMDPLQALFFSKPLECEPTFCFWENHLLKNGATGHLFYFPFPSPSISPMMHSTVTSRTYQLYYVRANAVLESSVTRHTQIRCRRFGASLVTTTWRSYFFELGCTTAIGRLLRRSYYTVRYGTWRTRRRSHIPYNTANNKNSTKRQNNTSLQQYALANASTVSIHQYEDPKNSIEFIPAALEWIENDPDGP